MLSFVTLKLTSDQFGHILFPSEAGEGDGKY